MVPWNPEPVARSWHVCGVDTYWLQCPVLSGVATLLGLGGLGAGGGGDGGGGGGLGDQGFWGGGEGGGWLGGVPG